VVKAAWSDSMSQKLFVLGLPGSGKSTVSRYIVSYIKRYYSDFFASRICDYDILYDMFEEDTAKKHFYPTEYDGFYVMNPAKYDAALKKLEKQIENNDFAENEIVLIEFARSDYLRAFQNFSEDFLLDAYFLFLDVDLEIGMKRVKDRVKHPDPSSRDDHFVSDYTFEYYRQKDNAKYLTSVSKQLTVKYGIHPNKIKIVHNTGPKKGIWHFVNGIIEKIIKEAPVLSSVF
jgi:dephospho-CoA kinase